MQINNFSNGQLWTIRPDSLETMLAALDKYQADPAVMAQLANFTPEPEHRFDFLLRDGVAIIPVTGPICQRGSFWSMIYGATPLTVLQQVLADALADPDVEALVLDFDSPGGTVAGTEAFSQVVANAKTEKPIISYASGNMCSAAYWIGSAADRIISEKTADIGSIGVAQIHFDRSEEYKEWGIKKTILSAGKYKALGNDAEPLSDLARKTFQGQLNYIYSLFVDTVAANRNVKPETVLEDMADGRIFIGQQAMDAGLVDEIGSLETAIQAAGDLADAANPVTTYFFKPNKESKAMKKDIEAIVTVEDLTAALPDLAAQLVAQGVASVDPEDITSKAIAAEQKTILGLVSAVFGEEPGVKFKALVDSGVTVDQYTAINGAGPAAGEETPPGGDINAQILANLQNSGAENPGTGGNGRQPAGFMVLVNQYKADNKCSKSEAMTAVREADPKAHTAYLAEQNKKA